MATKKELRNGVITRRTRGRNFIDVEWLQGGELCKATYALAIWLDPPKREAEKLDRAISAPPIGHYRGPREET